MPGAVAHAVAGLRAAIEGLQPVGEEQDPERQGDTTWQVISLVCLRGWVAAIESDLAVAASALRSCRRARRWDLRERRFEEAVWRLVSARDRLSALLALALGTPVLKKDGGGVRFSPDVKKLYQRISAMASKTDAAAKVEAARRLIEDHEAVYLRHVITHKIPSVLDVPPLVVLENVYLLGDTSVRFEHHHLVGRKLNTSLDPTALLDEGLASAKDLFEVVIQATQAVADLIADQGLLHPPRVCVYESKPGSQEWRLRRLEPTSEWHPSAGGRLT